VFMGGVAGSRLRESSLRLGWVRFLRIVLLSYLGLVAVVYFAQRGLIYYPSRAPMEALVAEAARLGLEPWVGETGEYQGWVARQEGGRGRLVVFHGNAGQALNRAYFADIFGESDEEGFAEIYLFEYPGYGARAGKPGEQRIFEAARRAVAPLLSDEAGEPVYLLGESLGGGPASRLAAEWPGKVAGLLLITPFTSLAAAGQKHYPYLPVGLLLRDRYDNAKHLESYAGPVVFLLAEEDAVVPAELGRQLHERYGGPKQLLLVEGAGHNTILDGMAPDRWREISAFLRREAP